MAAETAGLPVREATAEEYDLLQQWAGRLSSFCAAMVPRELEMPGSSSLLVGALMLTAARFIAACPAEERGLAIENAQEYLMNAAMDLGRRRDEAPRVGGDNGRE